MPDLQFYRGGKEAFRPATYPGLEVPLAKLWHDEA